MIVTGEHCWLQMVFAVHGTTLGRTWPCVLFVTVFALLITYTSSVLGNYMFLLTTAPLTVVGIALAIFLGFRNNAAYDHHLEDRKLWSSIVSVTRTFEFRVLTVIQKIVSEADVVKKLHSAQISSTLAFVNVRHRLRDSALSVELTDINEIDLLELAEQYSTDIPSSLLPNGHILRRQKRENL